MDYVELFISLLQNPDLRLDALEQREALVVLANHCLGFIEGCDGEAKRNLVQLLGLVRPSVEASGVPAKLILIDCLLFQLTQQRAYFHQAISKALAEPHSDLGVQMATVIHLSRIAFVDAPGRDVVDEVFDYRAKHGYWTRLVSEAQTLVEGQKLGAPRPAQGAKTLILMDQFLAPPHAPTVDALAFAKHLSEDYGQQVMVMSTCAMGKQLYVPILPSTPFNINEKLSAVSTIAFDGYDLLYDQPEDGKFNSASFLRQVRLIRDYNPSLVIVIGAQNILAEILPDVLGSDRFILQYPTYSGLPLNARYDFLMWRQPTVAETQLMQHLLIRDRFRFSHYPGFEPPQKGEPLSRSQFAIPKEAFVYAIVGMRLDSDVKDDFLAMLEALHAADGRIHFLFVGHFQTYEQVKAKHGFLHHAASFIGFHKDIMAVYALCDGFINPRRSGGGSAIVHAMSAGLPCLSVAFGDAYDAVRNFPVIKTYHEMADVAARLVADEAFRLRYRQMAAEASQLLNSKAPLIARIMTEYAAFLDRRASPI